MFRKGRLIVIDGSDGAGKATQTKILSDTLKKEGKEVVSFAFPDYRGKFGKIIAKILRGEMGSLDQIDPHYFASLFAEDRKAAKHKIKDALDEGKIVILDRYVASNLYQAAKFDKGLRRKLFIRWLYNLEYRKNRMPKEDCLIYLHVPITISQKLMEERGSQEQLKGRVKDIHEENQNYLEKVQEVYLQQVHRYRNWIQIDCVEKNEMKDRQEIAELVYTQVKKYVK